MTINSIHSFNFDTKTHWGVDSTICHFTINGQDLINSWVMKIWMGN
jgi:hypothetical protein